MKIPKLSFFASLKGTTRKKKKKKHIHKNAPKVSNFFPFRLDPLSEGSQNNFDKVSSLENLSVHHENTPM